MIFGEPDSIVGTKLGDYEILNRLGSGGMGIVYEAVQPLIGKRAAVKILRPEIAADSVAVERLLREARAVNAIRHRNIIDIFGFGETPDGRQYFVMELLEGMSLRAYMSPSRGRLPLAESLTILDEVLAALGAAHEADIIHRDLKPSNVFMVVERDGSQYVKLLDFGLAKTITSRAHTISEGVTILGTPRYMSPEQIRNEQLGPETDLYSFGVMAFELVTGRPPFDAASVPEVLLSHTTRTPPAARELEPTIPIELDALIVRLLDKRPEKRPRSATAVRAMLEPIRREYGATKSNVWGRLTQVDAFSRDVPVTQPNLVALEPPLLFDESVEVSKTAPVPAVADWAGPDADVSLTFIRIPQRSVTTTMTAAPVAVVAVRSHRWAWGVIAASAVVIALAIGLMVPEREVPQAPTVVQQPAQPVIEEAPKPQPVVVAVEPPQKHPVKVRSAPKPKSEPSRAELIARIDRLDTSGAGAVASALLEKARANAKSAKTAAERRSVADYLDDWEKKFGKRSKGDGE